MKMNHFPENLYDYQKREWDKIQIFIASEKNIFKSPNQRKNFPSFISINNYKPIHINQIWKYSKNKIEFEIVCLDYRYHERENIGDGQIGSPSRVETSSFTSFWVLINNIKEIPKVIVEPITPIKKLNQLVKGKRINGRWSFNLNYVFDTEIPEDVKSFLNTETQKLFVKKKKIWFESSGDAILIRDDKPIEFESFKRKITFTKELIEKGRLMKRMQ